MTPESSGLFPVRSFKNQVLTLSVSFQIPCIRPISNELFKLVKNISSPFLEDIFSNAIIEIKVKPVHSHRKDQVLQKSKIILKDPLVKLGFLLGAYSYKWEGNYKNVPPGIPNII